MNRCRASLRVQKGDTFSVALYAAAHFFVDCISAYLILGRLSGKDHFSEMILIYNFCAFALQMPLGAFADQMVTCTWLSAAGMGLLTLLSVSASSVVRYPAVLAVLTGIGNALFHIGCGTQVLRTERDNCRDSGLFVSTGAIGLFLGSRCANMESGKLWHAVPSIFCFLFFILIAADAMKKQRNPASMESSDNCSVINWVICLICPGILFLTVVLRSFLGSIVSFPWRKEYAAALVCCIALGKMLGGVISDLFGERRTIQVSLLLAAVLFLVSEFPGAGLAAMLLFNMTMPVTLVCLSRIIGKPGLAFGILTFALFVGYLPLPFGFAPSSFKPLLYAAISMLSLVLMCLLQMRKDHENQGKAGEKRSGESDGITH